MRRRWLMQAVGAGSLGSVFAVPQAVAQARPTLPRIGILSFDPAPSATNPDTPAAFTRGLRELGYVEGQNIVIETRYADGRPDRLAPLAAELVQLKVDVILAGGPDTRDAARTSVADSRKAPAARTKMPAAPIASTSPAAISGLTGPSSSDAIRDRASERV